MPKANPIRKILSAVLAIVFLAWGILQIQEGRSQASYESAKRKGPAAIVELGYIPNRPDAYIGFARILANIIFPPDHEQAESFYERTLLMDPLSSLAWFELARERMLLGKADLARVALSRADELDPHYPKQRLGAVQLWSLLGEPDKAIEVGKKISQLGGSYRVAAAERMLAIGETPAQIFEQLELGAIPARETIAVLQVLRVADPGEMTRLFEQVDLTKFDTTELRDSLTRIACKPLIYDVALNLWRSESPDLRLVEGIIPADNLGLQHPPLSADYFLGWQKVPITAGIEPRWVAPADATAFATGYLQIVFASNKGEQHLGWSFYRTPVPPGKNIKFIVSLRQNDTSGVVSRLQIKLNDEVVQNSPPLSVDQDWKKFELLLPAVPKDSIVELILHCTVQSGRQSRGTAPELYLGTLGIESYDDPSPTAQEAPNP